MTAALPPPGSATVRRRSPTFTPRWFSPRPIGHPSSSTSVNNQWAISTFQGIARGGSGTFAPRPRLRHSGAQGRQATTIWRSMRSPAGPPSGRAAISGRPSSNMSPTVSAPIPPLTIQAPTGPRRNPKPGRSAIPVLRLKKHLIVRGAWSEERHVQAEAEIMDEVITAQRMAEEHGTLQCRRQALGAGHLRGRLCRNAAAPAPPAPAGRILTWPE